MKYLLLIVLLLAGCTQTYRSPDLENDTVRWMSEAFPTDTPAQPEITYAVLYRAHLAGIENQLQLWQLNQKYWMVNVMWRLP